MVNKERSDLAQLILYRNDIVEIVNSRTKLDAWNQAKCPFCHAAGSTLTVDAEHQYFCCSECRIEGDLVEFLRVLDREPPWLVGEKLAKRVGIVAGSLYSDEEELLDEHDDVKFDRRDALRFYENKLSYEDTRYLQDQGLTYQTIERFHLGYAAGDLHDHCSSGKGIGVERALQAGLLVKLNDGSLRDFFENRIVFPHLMFGLVGNITGLSLRGDEPKYLQIPDPVASLYNEAALRKPEVILVETPLDCLSAEQQGLPSAALVGLSFPPEFIPRLSRCGVVYVCMKADSKGLDAALAIGEVIGDKSKIVRLPEGLSLVEYLKDHSKDEFEKLLREAHGPFETEIELIDQGLEGQELNRKLFPILERMASLEDTAIDTLIFRDIENRFSPGIDELHSYRKLVEGHRARGADH
jgi:DNA primase